MKADSLFLPICGPGLCGKTTALLAILKYAGVNVDPIVVFGKKDSVRFQWILGQDGSAVVESIVLGAVSKFHFDDLKALDENLWAARDLGLWGRADGMLIVLDSQWPMQKANFRFLADLERWLEWCGSDSREVPRVYVFNKIDLVGARGASDLARDHGLAGSDVYTCEAGLHNEIIPGAFDRLVRLASKGKLGGRLECVQGGVYE